jgi:hypothetical protein
VLIDAIWKGLADKHETLRASCFVELAIERRVDLALSEPCEFNRWGKPSWFDLFSQL